MRVVRRLEERSRAEPRGAEDGRRVLLSVREVVVVDAHHRETRGEVKIVRLSGRVGSGRPLPEKQQQQQHGSRGSVSGINVFAYVQRDSYTYPRLM